MVHKSPQQRSLNLAILVFAFFLGITSAVLSAWIFKKQTVRPAPKEENVVQETQPEEETRKLPKLINFQPVVDEWVSTLNEDAKVGIEIFDLDNNQIVASLNENEIFPTESLYKLFVTYEGYLLTEQRIEDKDSPLGNGYTFGECLDLAIRESNSPCAETLRARIGSETIQNKMDTDFGLENSNLANLTSTPDDITKMMTLFYIHPDFSPETWEDIQDSMLNQPPVDNGLCGGPCDWRRGLPSGFNVAKVYNKVGWLSTGSYWASYHDTAIVEFENPEHHYIVTVMTSKVDFEDISRFGTMLENTVLQKN